MVFRNKQKPPLEEAMAFVDRAVEIAYQYKRDKKYIPTATSLKSLENLLEALWQSHCTLEYIIRSLRRRSAEKVEGSPKYADKGSFKYHNPG